MLAPLAPERNAQSVALQAEHQPPMATLVRVDLAPDGVPSVEP
jgi:hypothetical protein